MVSNEKSDRLIISGTRGEVRLTVHGSDPITIKTKHRTSYLDLPLPSPIEEPMITSVVNNLLHQDPSLCSGRDALQTMKTLDSVLDKYYGRRIGAFCDRPESWSSTR